MAQLAIIGHKTRGKEVIEILEMLGYINRHNYVADCDSLCFHGGKCTGISYIYYDWVNGCFGDEDLIVFTLEEFLEKFPYKVGDKVIVTGLPEYPKIINFMKWFDDDIHYSFDNETWFLPSALNLYKEETMETMETITIDDFKANTKEWLIDKLHGMVISKAIKTIGDIHEELHKPQYPKTHVECCEILYPNENFQTVAQPIKGHNGKQLFALQKLLVCRDAYWKIAGEQMGLGKPWAPDWKEPKIIKYTIQAQQGYTYTYYDCSRHNVLSFPTREMRDTFYKNFKSLIEQCKELL